MKKIILVLLTFLMVLPLAAQEHFKFMGLPIDGTIDQFQKELATKGWTYDAKVSKNAEVGIRWYDGRFFNEKSRLMVQYIPKTKVVHSCHVIIVSRDEIYASETFEHIIKALKEKYSEAQVVRLDTAQDNEIIFPSTAFVIGNTGAIQFFVQHDYNGYYININYVDIENFGKNINLMKEDL